MGSIKVEELTSTGQLHQVVVFSEIDPNIELLCSFVQALHSCRLLIDLQRCWEITHCVYVFMIFLPTCVKVHQK